MVSSAMSINKKLPGTWDRPGPEELRAAGRIRTCALRRETGCSTAELPPQDAAGRNIPGHNRIRMCRTYSSALSRSGKILARWDQKGNADGYVRRFPFLWAVAARAINAPGMVFYENRPARGVGAGHTLPEHIRARLDGPGFGVDLHRFGAGEGDGHIVQAGGQRQDGPAQRPSEYGSADGRLDIFGRPGRVLADSGGQLRGQGFVEFHFALAVQRRLKMSNDFGEGADGYVRRLNELGGGGGSEIFDQCLKSIQAS